MGQNGFFQFFIGEVLYQIDRSQNILISEIVTAHSNNNLCGYFYNKYNFAGKQISLDELKVVNQLMCEVDVSESNADNKDYTNGLVYLVDIALEALIIHSTKY